MGLLTSLSKWYRSQPAAIKGAILASAIVIMPQLFGAVASIYGTLMHRPRLDTVSSHAHFAWAYAFPRRIRWDSFLSPVTDDTGTASAMLSPNGKPQGDLAFDYDLYYKALEAAPNSVWSIVGGPFPVDMCHNQMSNEFRADGGTITFEVLMVAPIATVIKNAYLEVIYEEDLPSTEELRVILNTYNSGGLGGGVAQIFFNDVQANGISKTYPLKTGEHIEPGEELVELPYQLEVDDSVTMVGSIALSDPGHYTVSILVNAIDNVGKSRSLRREITDVRFINLNPKTYSTMPRAVLCEDLTAIIVQDE